MMARQPREKSATDYYHIMMRGINREFIYETVKEKHYFMNLLKEELSPCLVGYCLMDNHVHLLVNDQLEKLSLVIKKINVKYAMQYNYHNQRVGHLFQNRYKSEAIHTEPYLIEVIRYIHNNPVKAGMIQKTEEYQWSSYKEYLGNTVVVAEHHKAFILSLFSGNINGFIRFHQQKDDYEYLDTKEEVELNRINLAQAVITEFCNETGIFDAPQIKNEKRYIQEIIVRLLKKTKLSHRDIARLLEVTRGIIHHIASSKDNKQKLMQ
jgi:putative transposase